MGKSGKPSRGTGHSRRDSAAIEAEFSELYNEFHRLQSEASQPVNDLYAVAVPEANRYQMFANVRSSLVALVAANTKYEKTRDNRAGGKVSQEKENAVANLQVLESQNSSTVVRSFVEDTLKIVDHGVTPLGPLAYAIHFTSSACDNLSVLVRSYKWDSVYKLKTNFDQTTFPRDTDVRKAKEAVDKMRKIRNQAKELIKTRSPDLEALRFAEDAMSGVNAITYQFGDMEIGR